MMSWSSCGGGKPKPSPLEVAWEPSARSGYEPAVVMDATGPVGFGLRCFEGGEGGIDPSRCLRPHLPLCWVRLVWDMTREEVRLPPPRCRGVFRGHVPGLELVAIRLPA
jgi:hypothetical protein